MYVCMYIYIYIYIHMYIWVSSVQAGTWPSKVRQGIELGFTVFGTGGDVAVQMGFTVFGTGGDVAVQSGFHRLRYRRGRSRPKPGRALNWVSPSSVQAGT